MIALGVRFEQSGDLADLDEAADSASDPISYAALLSNLGGVLQTRFSGQLARCTEHYREAAPLLGEHDPFRLVSTCLIEVAIGLAQQGMPGPAKRGLPPVQRSGVAKILNSMVLALVSV